MAKLKDLLPKRRETDTIEIQGVEIPVVFNFQTIEYVSEAYGKSFQQLSNDMADFGGKKTSTLDTKMLNIMKSLLYGMVRSGGTETTPDELLNAIPFTELPRIFKQISELFSSGYFQTEDTEKIVGDKHSKK